MPLVQSRLTNEYLTLTFTTIMKKTVLSASTIVAKTNPSIPQDLKSAEPQTSPSKLTAANYIEAAQSDATKHGYAIDVRHFYQHGGSIPATLEQVIDYIVKAASVCAVATLQRRLIAIHKAHIDAGHMSMLKHPQVKRTMQGVRRTLGTRQRRVKAVVKDDLLALMATQIPPPMATSNSPT